ncbi:MAG: tRNA threonylcarbamoyladenosine biosynthesis protein TsaB [Arenicella sp.]|jgi:tRNA threonylcarbamoyladenosine biosynthesis protein TsaB
MPNPSATILAIETATSSCSVALSHGDLVFQQAQVGSNIHSQVLLTMVQEVLAQASLVICDIDAVAVGQGPGSFTGLRIGVGVAQGLAYGVNCPMIGVSSLDALAHQANLDGHVIAAIDARMGEIYCCQYRNVAGQLQRLNELEVLKPAVVNATANQFTNVFLVGNAWSEYWQEFDLELLQHATHLEKIVYPSAVSILHLAQSKYRAKETVCAAEFAPEYVRNNVAKKAVAKAPTAKIT